MTQEDKDLLFKYLCMALPYGVKILHEGWNFEWDDELSTVERVVGIDEKFIYTKVIDTHNGEEYREDSYSIDSFDDKPYLRPMSSITEDEFKELKKIQREQSICSYHTISMDLEFINWYLAHHFDINHLIQRGLAIEVTESNNPYEI